MKFSKININIVLERILFFGGVGKGFSYLFSIFGKAAIKELIVIIIVTDTYSHLIGIVYLCGGGVLGFTSPFRTLTYSGGIVPINQSVGNGKLTMTPVLFFSISHENSFLSLLGQIVLILHLADHSQVLGPGS